MSKPLIQIVKTEQGHRATLIVESGLFKYPVTLRAADTYTCQGTEKKVFSKHYYLALLGEALPSGNVDEVTLSRARQALRERLLPTVEF